MKNKGFNPRKVNLSVLRGGLKKEMDEVKSELCMSVLFEIKTLISKHLTEYFGDSIYDIPLASEDIGFNVGALQELKKLVKLYSKHMHVKSFDPDSIVVIEIDHRNSIESFIALQRTATSQGRFDLVKDAVRNVSTIEDLEHICQYYDRLLHFVEKVLIPGYKKDWHAIKEELDKVTESLPERLKAARVKAFMAESNS